MKKKLLAMLFAIVVAFSIVPGIVACSTDTFDNKASLESITIRDNVKSIGDWAFYNWSLTSITLPRSVTNIGKYAFYECKLLTSITFNGTMEQWKAVSKGDYWDTDTGNYTVHCTDGDIAKQDS